MQTLSFSLKQQLIPLAQVMRAKTQYFKTNSVIEI